MPSVSIELQCLQRSEKLLKALKTLKAFRAKKFNGKKNKNHQSISGVKTCFFASIMDSP
jgi:hypothetical protein